ncbi:carbonic anhydrase family protein [soil metagenome]
MKRKYFLLILILIVSSNLFAQSEYHTMTKEMQEATSPSMALQYLKDGNKRFVDNTMHKRDYLVQVDKTSKAQYPFAIVLSCIDSRAPSELIFDQGVGDVFNARVAGNVIDEDILGSIEFACKVTGAKLVLVMGHSNCGAVKGACDDVKLGNLTGLISKIKKVADKVEGSNRTSKNTEFVELVARENVINSINSIREQSSILKEMEDRGEISIKGAMYDLETGIVTFY